MSIKDKVKDISERGSKYISAKLNPTLTRVAVDTGSLAGVIYGINQLPDLSSPTLLTLGGGAALGLVGIDKLVTKLIKRKVKQKPMNSRWQTAILAGLLAVPCYSLSDDIVDVYQDLEGIVTRVAGSSPTNIDESHAREVAQKLPVSREYELPNFDSVRLLKKGNRIGDVQRTYRFKPLIDAVEDKYGMPDGVIAGLIMQESFGDPLQANSSGDGGIGLIHTQGPTAKYLGLKIYGRSKKSHDPRHGRELKKMFERCDYELECIAEHDDRAHILKNLDAIARYMMQGYNAHSNWDAAIQWVRGPGLVNKRTGIKYLAKVKSKRKAFNTLSKEAERKFNKMNRGTTWDEYQNAYHEMCEKNFGLNHYK